MTALSAVRTAWSNVLENATVQGYTANQYTYNIAGTTNESISNTGLFYAASQLNFVQYEFIKNQNFAQTKEKNEIFNVIISYYREIDIDGDNFRSITDFFDSLFDVVRSEIGYSWNSTIDFYEVGDVSMTTDQLDNRACWVGTCTYTGTKNIALT